MTDRRLIEVAFPLEQTSIDSVAEKYGPRGHISGFHLWPARRPLAASRAALVAMLLKDPGTPEKRRELCERLGGQIEKVIQKKRGPGANGEERIVHETVGGILRWGREIENQADVKFFRDEILKSYGGRAPRVLDPFAGGGAIPLEAMRLGCEVTAVDINPVAWFILKCTLEYPQRFAGQKQPLPDCVRGDYDVMEAFFKSRGMKGAMLRTQLLKLGLDGAERSMAEGQSSLDLDVQGTSLDADLAWHVRAWGWWVSREARRELAKYYRVYADWQPLKGVEDWRTRQPDMHRPMQLVPLRDDGTADIDSLNATISPAELADPSAPRWVAKPAIAYLWARTVVCKNCRATIPLLKTLWLVKKEAKRVRLRLEPRTDRSGVVFSIETNVPVSGGNNAQRREHDRRIGQGTMNRAGAWCPCCGKPGTVAVTPEDIRGEAVAGRLAAEMTAVVIHGSSGREYRRPSDAEIAAASIGEDDLDRAAARIPFGLPDEPVPRGASRAGGGSPFTVHLYGMTRWRDLHTRRQLLSLATLAHLVRSAAPNETIWPEAVASYLSCALDRLADHATSLATWYIQGENVKHTFVRYALSMTWDYAETNPLYEGSGSWHSAYTFVSSALDSTLNALSTASPPVLLRQSVLTGSEQQQYDVILTDPPYYDAIPYADLMDLFFVWLRRSSSERIAVDGFRGMDLSPKWNPQSEDGELIDDSSRYCGDRVASRAAYERGMARAFRKCRGALSDSGMLGLVFAHKNPAAWEVLVGALVAAGFVVESSWPIRTENATRSRARSAAALSSSLWLICRPRALSARTGWDNTVLQEMRENLKLHLREFWDAGIRGPDFVWAATGPALEAYSKHPVVKKANDPGQTMSVSEFLRAVRRLVVEFVVGRVLSELTRTPAASVSDAPIEGVGGLDDVTTYYLLHRHDFGMNDAPAGACILYALSCNLSEGELADRHSILLRTGGVVAEDDGEPEEGDADAEGEVHEGSGSTFKLRPWKQRRRAGFGAASGNGSSAVPIVDTVHHLMHLWIDGDVHKVNAYLDERGLRRSEVFRHVLQALIELADEGSDERSVLERISNHVHARGQAPATLRDVGLGAPKSSEQE